MKSDWSHLEQFRKRDEPMGSPTGHRGGAFFVPYGRVRFVIIASEGIPEIPWEHVSARAEDYKGGRVPTWAEMCAVKNLFWDEEECVVQYHPPKSDYINNHPHVLHLWRPTAAEMPRPPKIAVGI